MKPGIIHISLKVFFGICITVNAFFANAQSTEIQYLSGKGYDDAIEWEFFCTDGTNSGKWSSIPVPSNWEFHGFGSYNYGHVKEEDRVKETGMYKHDFNVPDSWKGKKVNIVFDGVMTDTEVKINGETAGEIHQGGFYRFKYDISKLLKYGRSNYIEVTVQKYSSNHSVNLAERHADFWVFGGIYRPVYLEALPSTHIEYFAVDARADASIRAEVKLRKLKSNAFLECFISDLNDELVGKSFSIALSKGQTDVEIKGFIEDIKSWTPEFPHLYQLNLSLKIDGKYVHTVQERIGFRTVELKPRDGIYVNGVKVILKGVNRHTFRPESGRCTNKIHSIKDVMLIKEMNMNAVRMSHYPPDKHFLEACDSLGLFVLDELTGWQDAYDSVVGEKLVKEMIIRDVNHPSIIIWDNGNEGGWNYSLDKWFDELDPQKRPLIHPWQDFREINTRHYTTYDEVGQQVAFSNSLIMPTEILHGLFDGGLGAGLEDYWRILNTSPLFAGMFLWVFADEAVLRVDQNGRLDSDGDHAPDGIIGPHGEKEGSFYTIKEIWSPVQFPRKHITESFNGELEVENKYHFTNLNQCRFEWDYVQLPFQYDVDDEKIIGSGTVESLDVKPGSKGIIKINIPENAHKADILRIKSIDPYGRELYTNTWVLKTPETYVNDVFMNLKNDGEVILKKKKNTYLVKTNELEMEFDAKSGNLISVRNENGFISFGGGASFAGCDAEFQHLEVDEYKEGVKIRAIFDKNTEVCWTVQRNSLVKYEATYLPYGLQKNIGVNFYSPEEKITSMEWFGKGPYRVWKNRMKGTVYGVWEKEYNNTATGESYDNLVYPEFKGYHANLYWVNLTTSESTFQVFCATEDVFLRMFTPDTKTDRKGLIYDFPEGGISFLQGISAIGTKFKKAESLGPMSQPNMYRYQANGLKNIKLIFDFR